MLGGIRFSLRFRRKHMRKCYCFNMGKIDRMKVSPGEKQQSETASFQCCSSDLLSAVYTKNRFPSRINHIAIDTPELNGMAARCPRALFRADTKKKVNFPLEIRLIASHPAFQSFSPVTFHRVNRNRSRSGLCGIIIE